jgi:aminopeptidase
MTNQALHRLELLADQIAASSLKLEKGQDVLIYLFGEWDDFCSLVISKIYKKGAVPLLRTFPTQLLEALLVGCTKEQILLWVKQEMYQMRNVHAFIKVDAGLNELFASSQVKPDMMTAFNDYFLNAVQNRMIESKQWLWIKKPSDLPPMKKQENASDMDLSNFLSACLIDYSKLERNAVPLLRKMTKTDRIRITAPGTDITFSIRNMPVLFCGGEHNLPDGEIFTAPVLETVEGSITVNVPTMYRGYVFHNMKLKFHKGHVVEAVSENDGLLWSILNIDAGASRIGEFGIGLNLCITSPMMHPIYDEKMAGTVHLALGQAYKEADNGNKSAVHWDLVLDQSDKAGGGEIWFDDECIRRNGLFIKSELLVLNDPILNYDR